MNLIMKNFGSWNLKMVFNKLPDEKLKLIFVQVHLHTWNNVYYISFF
jgi:hypothetical protein